jgi:hypothetical protein
MSLSVEAVRRWIEAYNRRHIEGLLEISGSATAVVVPAHAGWTGRGSGARDRTRIFVAI